MIEGFSYGSNPEALKNDEVSDLIFERLKKRKEIQKALEDGKLISSNQNIPAPLHAAIARSIYDLIAALSERQEKH